MKCRRCNHPSTRVVETRVQEDGITKRRRACEECGFRFNSFEIPPEAESWVRSNLARWRASLTSEYSLKRRRVAVVEESAMKKLRQGWTVEQVVSHFRVAERTVKKWSKAYRAAEVQPERDAFRADVLAGMTTRALIEKYGYSPRTVYSRKHLILKASRKGSEPSP